MLRLGPALVGGLCALALAILPAPSTARACPTWQALYDRALLRPAGGTFYSVDALNPDIVRYHGRYLMFFSGNDVHTPAGRWKTGLAVSHSPAGRFRLTKLRGDYFNGGTVVWRGWLYQTRELNSGGGELARSRDGLRWQHVAPIPIYPRKGYPLIADYALRPVKRALRLYALARRSAVGLGGDIVALDFLDGRWRSPQTPANVDRPIGAG